MSELTKEARDANWRRKFLKKYRKALGITRTFRYRRLCAIYSSAGRTERNVRFMRKMREVA